MNLLLVHYAIGFLIVLTSLAAIFWAPARRYVLYVLVLQIVVGFAVWGVTKAVPPPAHWILAILNGGTYAMGTAFARRGRPRPLVIATYVIGFVIFAIVFNLGMKAVKG
jgi:hypothetical protein